MTKKVRCIWTSPSSRFRIRLCSFKILYICNAIWNSLWVNSWENQIVLRSSHSNWKGESWKCLLMDKSKAQIHRTKVITCSLWAPLTISLENWGWKFNRILRTLCYLLFVEIYINSTSIRRKTNLQESRGKSKQHRLPRRSSTSWLPPSSRWATPASIPPSYWGSSPTLRIWWASLMTCLSN